MKNRAISFLLIPLVAVVWCIEWSLYWLGVKRDTINPQPKTSRGKDMAFFVPIPEQKEAI